MMHALGYSTDTFDAKDPGRLCRGRERWIEPFELDEDVPPIHRLVITGAAFSDDSAADALRGIQHSGLDLPTVLTTVFVRRTLLAFQEDGHPADIPEGADGVELYSGFRAGGRVESLHVRWFKEVGGVREIREVFGGRLTAESGEATGSGEPDVDRVRGFALLDPDVVIDDALRDRFFLLVGMACHDSPPARYQPAAIPEILTFARAVVLLHRDKHGAALGIYSREPLRAEQRLQQLCEKEGALLVRFAIPPMLARWDRALAEAREEWESTHTAPFPVPPAPEGHRWEPRRRGRRGLRDELSREADESSLLDEEEDLAEELAGDMPEVDDLGADDEDDDFGDDEDEVGDDEDELDEDELDEVFGEE